MSQKFTLLEDEVMNFLGQSHLMKHNLKSAKKIGNAEFYLVDVKI